MAHAGRLFPMPLVHYIRPIVVVPSQSDPAYGTTTADLADGTGAWVNPDYALTDDSLVATWTAA